ncbi:helix-turn-helix domain-containing protein, partial [Bacillus haikouensis]|uniref:helix-turn-helix domain-containing protein n=1 Tax=Bacillus haikouensis TaxID=1510468 RepID=UPI001FE653A5
MKKVGKQIAQLRKDKKITQMELADLMGVSFQAISNWERGKTMPDISKLPELAVIFCVSIDEILNNSKGTRLVRGLVENDTLMESESIGKDEFIEAAPILTQDQADMVFQTFEADFSPEDLISIAPFINQNLIDDLAMNKLGSKGLEALAPIAPYISKDILDDCVIKSINNEDLSVLPAVAPFISQKIIDECAEKEYAANGMKGLTAIAPFISQDVIDNCAKKNF